MEKNQVPPPFFLARQIIIKVNGSLNPSQISLKFQKPWLTILAPLHIITNNLKGESSSWFQLSKVLYRKRWATDYDNK